MIMTVTIIKYTLVLNSRDCKENYGFPQNALG